LKKRSAAADSEIDMLICGASNVSLVRQGAPYNFLTAALTIPDYPTDDDILRGALKALQNGADSVMTARRLAVVEMLAREDIPVMGHLGLVPRKSTWRGGLRAVGRTASEALELMQDFRDLENAGAFSVEAEVIPADVLAVISPQTSLITVSLGSGPGGDVMYLFQNDICGENPLPRHARAFGDLAAIAGSDGNRTPRRAISLSRRMYGGKFSGAGRKCENSRKRVGFVSCGFRGQQLINMPMGGCLISLITLSKTAPACCC
jgi:3-methyl-2-oxobutanoate hydroxymethyltransferase